MSSKNNQSRGFKPIFNKSKNDSYKFHNLSLFNNSNIINKKKPKQDLLFKEQLEKFKKNQSIIFEEEMKKIELEENTFKYKCWDCKRKCLKKNMRLKKWTKYKWLCLKCNSKAIAKGIKRPSNFKMCELKNHYVDYVYHYKKSNLMVCDDCLKIVKKFG